MLRGISEKHGKSGINECQRAKVLFVIYQGSIIIYSYCGFTRPKRRAEPWRMADLMMPGDMADEYNEIVAYGNISASALERYLPVVEMARAGIDMVVGSRQRVGRRGRSDDVRCQPAILPSSFLAPRATITRPSSGKGAVA
jgi:hypothetical protein